MYSVLLKGTRAQKETQKYLKRAQKKPKKKHSKTIIAITVLDTKVVIPRTVLVSLKKTKNNILRRFGYSNNRLSISNILRRLC